MNKNIQTGIVSLVTFICSHFLKMSTTNAITLSAIIGFTFYVLFEVVSWRLTLDQRLDKIEQDLNEVKERNNSQLEIMSKAIKDKNISSKQSIEVMK
ncbi:hypothetical protein DQM11_03875 [Leuconostoc pseudomesenteroides]|jgi:hypothetical protein|uniref:Uncharacterized protein n=2 Tax=Leuconostoc TaxID=1243 RepID=A0A9X3EAV1_9LACO|nr:hypothetical protein [Leuconostoc falkenbergense]RDG19283.1 hypothetical protein DQM11_03875 [Leuconostoc pseudomesenteroides]MCT4411626.1 hypothetical protein [Leuconostoc falkenbergense]MCX7579687.1 hypothetical protein [Leuconostoc falkenbergense]MDV3546677.1 hypothetical protein [Leuconostoc falkenbergense]VTU70917.1 hypothetical protein AMBR_MGDJBKAP_01535 [Leuconostoc pseudomesenteroides]